MPRVLSPRLYLRLALTAPRMFVPLSPSLIRLSRPSCSTPIGRVFIFRLMLPTAVLRRLLRPRTFGIVSFLGLRPWALSTGFSRSVVAPFPIFGTSLSVVPVPLPPGAFRPNLEVSNFSPPSYLFLRCGTPGRPPGPRSSVAVLGSSSEP